MALAATYKRASRRRQAFVFWWAAYGPSIALSSSNDVLMNIGRQESKPHDIAINIGRSESKPHDIRMGIYAPLESSHDILMTIRNAETITD